MLTCCHSPLLELNCRLHSPVAVIDPHNFDHFAFLDVRDPDVYAADHVTSCQFDHLCSRGELIVNLSNEVSTR